MVTRKRCALCQHEDREELERMLESTEITCDTLDEREGWRSGTSAQHQRNHMSNFELASNPKCVICTDPMRKHYEESLHSGELDASELAVALNTTKVQVQRHMKHHLQPLVQQSAAVMLAKKEVNEVDMISSNIQKLDIRMNQVFDDLGNDLDPKMIDALAKLAREIRESLRFSLEAKGKLISKRQDTIIVAQMQIVQEVLAQNNPQIWLDIKQKRQERLQ